ncbi:uncharacterized protein BO80DRAFT_473666 [Aspergillus ibericus CBS 121593]|uniref:Uncharacterized protein n=1 Tax=Aspergillus ibericus CBS 121593 TaxID=1448316 RepID=A0A395H2J5_9EURO|nr:hypothetical protein BO80DRAFT_473666 [Aspergillus ibericus CBS 121593]RAL01435.1 hypothetical protein BO80DRAFT_473666 [Aspergillus ibericus CBS 121593]
MVVSWTEYGPSMSLLEYLLISLPPIPLQRVVRSRNTTNDHYFHRDITEIMHWPDFNYNSIIQEFGPVLNTVRMNPDPFMSPPAAIRDEPLFQNRWAGVAGQLTPIQYDGGSRGALVDNFRPDTAFVVVGGDYATSPNRGRSTVPADMIEYKQVLSQLNWYIRQHKARYGHILTNTEFVAVKRVEETNGRLALASPIPWSAGGHGQLSVLLGIWYLAMLTTRNDWSLEVR